jgi:phosphoesterase RecJ-like protein
MDDGLAPLSVLQEIREHLDAAETVILTTHITPDADGLGAALALMRHLRRCRKNARLINCSSTPSNLRFLVKSGEFAVFHPERHERVVHKADVIIATDLGGPARLGRMESAVREAQGTRIVIDHHRFDDDVFDVSLIVPKASSSAEITFELLQFLGARMDLDLAEPLYVGLISDTGNFSYQATTPRSHRMAATLLEAGVEPHAIWRNLSCQVSRPKMRALGASLLALRFEEVGQMVWTAVDHEFLERHTVPARDVFEVVNHFLLIKGVEVGVFFLQVNATRTKVSLRSAGRVDVCSLAKRYGGGGHTFAAGCTIDGKDFEAAQDEVLDAVVALIAALDEDETP